jgi:hypothetical protein
MGACGQGTAVVTATCSPDRPGCIALPQMVRDPRLQPFESALHHRSEKITVTLRLIARPTLRRH